MFWRRGDGELRILALQGWPVQDFSVLGMSSQVFLHGRDGGNSPGMFEKKGGKFKLSVYIVFWCRGDGE